MATERQIQANRANAKRSTGPVTEEGKQASSQNARRHDQLSSCIVLKAESTPQFDDLMDSLIDEFQPRTPNETALIETMAVARWKLSRNWIIHTALLEVETVKQDPSAGSAPVITALAFKSLADSSHSLHLLHRYEVSLDRQYSRALNNLLKVRAARNRGRRHHPPAPRIEPDLPRSRDPAQTRITKRTQFAAPIRRENQSKSSRRTARFHAPRHVFPPQTAPFQPRRQRIQRRPGQNRPSIPVCLAGSSRKPRSSKPNNALFS